MRSALKRSTVWLFGSSLEVDSMLWQLRRGKYGRRTSRVQFQGLPGIVGHVAGPRVWVCRRSVFPSSRQVPCVTAYIVVLHRLSPATIYVKVYSTYCHQNTYIVAGDNICRNILFTNFQPMR